MEKYRSDFKMVFGNSTGRHFSGHPQDNLKAEKKEEETKEAKTDVIQQSQSVTANVGVSQNGDVSKGSIAAERHPPAATVRQKTGDERIYPTIQRSKSDVRHESRISILQQQQAQRRGSNFELAFLLERGRTLDAKLFGGSDDSVGNDQLGVRTGSVDNVGSPTGTGGWGKGAGGGGGSRILLLPMRLRQALTKRRMSNSRFFPPRTSISSSLQGSTISISGPLDSLPEGAPSEMLHQGLDPVPHGQRVKDIDATMLWLQQEISSLKQLDRGLFRRLLSLGTEIHRLGGMESCQSYGTSLDMDDIELNRHRMSGIIDDVIKRNGDDSPMTSSPDKNVSLNLKDNKLVDLYTSCESFFR